MKKNLTFALLCVLALGLSSCGGKKAPCSNEQTCQTRYAYDECDACYELEANACEVNCSEIAEDEADITMINKF
jgi:hypothetical protein